MSVTYHVAKAGSNHNPGTAERPFQTIQRAADLALPGDTIIVHEGEYREWVNPPRGGLSNFRRITYEAAPGEHVVIKGSERITNWVPTVGNIWKAELPKGFFGQSNPYRKKVWGDWLVYRPNICHLGEVYLNGMSFYEAETLEELTAPLARETVLDHWTRQETPVKNVPQTRYLWYVETSGSDESSDESCAESTGDDSGEVEVTTIYANFQGADPRKELVEINVRPYCFYPELTGIDYLTVRGFEMAHAATPWAPPTADQPGLLGTHWSKGWIIENNHIHDAKCSAISLGKEISTGHNFKTLRHDKPGYQYQLESVFAALGRGWSRETIGSHIVRNNVIHDCGQNAVVGNLGCAFSEIYGNHIYNIAIKREFYGHEIAGIKLHAAIDVLIHDNLFHDCSLGIWLDWQAQGAQVSRNVFYRNNRDFFVEVTSGPHLVDHNIFTATYAIDNHAQGGAFVNNLICGFMNVRKIMDRSTPYHLPHSTMVRGVAKFYSGDDRFYHNIFVGVDGGDSDADGEESATSADATVVSSANENASAPRPTSPSLQAGTAAFDGYPASLAEYIELIDAHFPADHEAFDTVEQPVYIADNTYFRGAKAYNRESGAVVSAAFDPQVRISEEADGVYLELTLPADFETHKYAPLSTQTLARVRIVDAEFENPDGSVLICDRDLLSRGADRSDSVADIVEASASAQPEAVAGPIASLKAGKNRIKVWSF